MSRGRQLKPLILGGEDRLELQGIANIRSMPHRSPYLSFEARRHP